jgi:hypothetical protein
MTIDHNISTINRLINVVKSNISCNINVNNILSRTGQ